MSKVYSCPHCQTQNFATRSRLRKAVAVPMKCWKCGKAIRIIPTGRLKRESKKNL